MEIKKAFGLLTLPAIAALQLTGCGVSTSPEAAANLMLQCGSDSKLETAKQRFEMIPGQRLDIGGNRFQLTGSNSLRFIDENIEISDGYILGVKGDNLPYSDRRYRVYLSSAEMNRTIVDVFCNCQDPKADPK